MKISNNLALLGIYSGFLVDFFYIPLIDCMYDMMCKAFFGQKIA